MKVSINLAQEYSNVDLKGISRPNILNSIGAQLGAVEEVIDWNSKFEGVVVANVVECIKHPNADKLNVCKIDDGGVTKSVERDANGLVQVVCGAPNVKAGIFVAWIPPTATVPSTIGTSDEFILEARELRGVISNGMLASAHELGVNDDHSGLLEITEINASKKPVAGEDFSLYFGLDDVVIDCENKMFTHRPDCFGNLGVARELAGINGLNFKSPEWYLDALEIKKGSDLKFVSKNDITNMVPRFMAVVLEGVKVEPSSLKMQVDLARVGLRSLNNVVDYTNYFMHLTAQPTHAFDYDKIKAFSNGDPTIFPRMAKEGEELTLLNGKKIKLNKDDIVIATDTKAVALAGVMGGIETEVDDNTKNIIVECATFDMYAIRRTSMRHGIFSDAVSRFNKGQSPWQNDKILAKLVNDIVAATGAKTGVMVDIKDKNLKPQKPVNIKVEFINKRLGREFSAEEVEDLLRRTEFEVSVSGDDVKIIPPFWRMDIECQEDVVEEVGRLYGFGNLPTKLPVRKSAAVKRNITLSFKRNLAAILKSFGANEVLTYSFVNGDLIKNAGQNINDAYQIRNAISPELQYYRLSLTPSLLQHIHPNIKSGYDEFAIFELGKIHNKKFGLNDEKVPHEKDTLAFVLAINDKLSKNKNSAAYYSAQNYLRELMKKLNVEFQIEEFGTNQVDIADPFDNSRRALIVDKLSGKTLGVLGEYTSDLINRLKLPKFTSGFELYTSDLIKASRNNNYVAQSKFPSTQQDMTLEVEKTTKYITIQDNLNSVISAISKSNGYQISIYPAGIYSADEYSKRATFKFIISHHAKTLKTEETNNLMDDIASSMGASIGAKRV